MQHLRRIGAEKSEHLFTGNRYVVLFNLLGHQVIDQQLLPGLITKLRHAAGRQIIIQFILFFANQVAVGAFEYLPGDFFSVDNADNVFGTAGTRDIGSPLKNNHTGKENQDDDNNRENQFS